MMSTAAHWPVARKGRGAVPCAVAALLHMKPAAATGRIMSGVHGSDTLIMQLIGLDQVYDSKSLHGLDTLIMQLIGQDLSSDTKS